MERATVPFTVYNNADDDTRRALARIEVEALAVASILEHVEKPQVDGLIQRTRDIARWASEALKIERSA